MCSLVRTTPPAAIAPDAASRGVWVRASGRCLSVALALVVLLSSAARAGTGNAELQAVLDAAHPSDEIAVIVSYRGKFRPRHFRKLTYEEGGEDLASVAEARRVRRREIIEGLRQSAASEGAPIVEFARGKGARSVRVLWLSNSIALRATREVIWQLLADPRVAQVRLDQIVEAPLPMAGPTGPVEWNISAVGAPALWTQGYDGNGAVVAILDSGVDVAHPDLAASYRGGSNSWYDPYGEHASPYDRLGHGTQALGLIVGGSDERFRHRSGARCEMDGGQDLQRRRQRVRKRDSPRVPVDPGSATEIRRPTMRRTWSRIPGTSPAKTSATAHSRPTSTL